MREVPLVYARKHPGDDYYLLADDLLLTDQVTLASKFIELECDTIFRNNEKNLMNSNKKFIKEKRLIINEKRNLYICSTLVSVISKICGYFCFTVLLLKKSRVEV